MFAIRGVGMSIHETSQSHESMDTSAATRVIDARRKRAIQFIWLAAMFVTLTVAFIGLFDLHSALDYGCLCNTTMVGERDGEIILVPFPDIPTNGLFQDGDVILAVDGQPLPAEIPLQDAISLIDSGPAGSTLELTLQTGTEASRTISLTRDAGYAIVQGGLALGMSLDGAIVYSLALPVAVFLGFAGTAGFIAWRRADDWMTLYTAWALLTLALLAPSSLPIWGAFTAAHPSVIWEIYESAALTAIFLCFLIFPNGRVYPRWSPGLVLVFGLWLLLIGLDILIVSDILANLISLAFILLGIFAIRQRYRYFFTPLLRQQTKWVIYGLILTILILQSASLISAFLYNLHVYGITRGYLLWRAFNAIALPLSSLALLVIPLTFAFSVLRYRLWDIDVVINRSLVFGTVTAVLALTFMGSVLILQNLLSGANPLIALAISASGPLLLFNPARKRAQHFVDRRIYGLRFDLNELNAAQKLPEIRNPGALSGRKLGEYLVLDVIGKGGMGEVYKAQINGQPAALKILPDDLARQEDFHKRFLREAQTLTALSHRHIVSMMGAGESEGVNYLAMEFIDGEELGARLKASGPLPTDEACAILGDIAAALDYAHQQGFVHRDIKPSNVMLRRSSDGETWEAVLMDFGVAKIHDARTGITGTGAIGTIDYMAPEQIMAAKEVDTRADIYALGVMAYEMLTGQRPFKGGPAQVMFAHLQQPAPDPRDLRPDLARAAAKAILQALEKQPEDRFQTASAFIAALH